MASCPGQASQVGVSVPRTLSHTRWSAPLLSHTTDGRPLLGCAGFPGGPVCGHRTGPAGFMARKAGQRSLLPGRSRPPAPAQQEVARGSRAHTVSPALSRELRGKRTSPFWDKPTHIPRWVTVRIRYSIPIIQMRKLRLLGERSWELRALFSEHCHVLSAVLS